MASQTRLFKSFAARRAAFMCAFVVVLGLSVFVSNVAGMRGAGIIAVVAAGFQLRHGEIAYDWDEEESSGYIRGLPATALSLVLAVLGMSAVLWPNTFLLLLDLD